MAIPAFLSRNGVTVYPVTIADAIIDPETGEPAKLGTDMEYTINNTSADANGNFTITGALIGAAEASHSHAIADVAGLQDAIDGKSASNHTHTMVTGVVVNNQTLTGDVRLTGEGNVQISQSDGNISISITPYTADQTQAITDSNLSTNYRVFVGTAEEWATFKPTMENGSHYLVFIRS